MADILALLLPNPSDSAPIASATATTPDPATYVVVPWVFVEIDGVAPDTIRTDDLGLRKAYCAATGGAAQRHGAACARRVDRRGEPNQQTPEHPVRPELNVRHRASRGGRDAAPPSASRTFVRHRADPLLNVRQGPATRRRFRTLLSAARRASWPDDWPTRFESLPPPFQDDPSPSQFFLNSAEREGFEPSVGFWPTPA
jgi:hypothetical protein